jgi:hypothetical protein
MEIIFNNVQIFAIVVAIVFWTENEFSIFFLVIAVLDYHEVIAEGSFSDSLSLE